MLTFKEYLRENDNVIQAADRFQKPKPVEPEPEHYEEEPYDPNETHTGDDTERAERIQAHLEDTGQHYSRTVRPHLDKLDTLGIHYNDPKHSEHPAVKAFNQALAWHNQYSKHAARKHGLQ